MNKAQYDARLRENTELGLWLKGQMSGLVKKGYTKDQAYDRYEAKAVAWWEEQETLNREKERFETSDNFVKKMGGNPGGQAGFGPQSENKSMTGRTPSLFDIPAKEYKGLFEAVQKRLPSYRIDTKAAFAETGFQSGSLPPILLPWASLDEPYEPDRAFSHFKQLTAPEARAVEYMQHVSNTNPAAAVAELGVKPDLGPVFTTVTTPFVKIAALLSISMEATSDEKYFMEWLPRELQRAVTDAETDEVVNGSGSSPHMLGILNASGTLTRAQGSDTVIDAIRKSINDIRVGSSFTEANLILVNPGDWADIQLQKSTGGLYLLNPTDPNSIGNMTELFGCTIVQNTYVPSGTIVVLDKNWVYAWTRQSMFIDINQYGSDGSTNYWTQNAVSFRCEERIAVGYARPTAINILTLA